MGFVGHGHENGLYMGGDPNHLLTGTILEVLPQETVAVEAVDAYNILHHLRWWMSMILRVICLVHHSLLPPTNHWLIRTHLPRYSMYGLFTYMYGEFLWNMLVNIPVPNHWMSGLWIIFFAHLKIQGIHQWRIPNALQTWYLVMSSQVCPKT